MKDIQQKAIVKLFKSLMPNVMGARYDVMYDDSDKVILNLLEEPKIGVYCQQMLEEFLYKQLRDVKKYLGMSDGIHHYYVKLNGESINGVKINKLVFDKVSEVEKVSENILNYTNKLFSKNNNTSGFNIFCDDDQLRFELPVNVNEVMLNDDGGLFKIDLNVIENKEYSKDIASELSSTLNHFLSHGFSIVDSYGLPLHNFLSSNEVDPNGYLNGLDFYIIVDSYVNKIFGYDVEYNDINKPLSYFSPLMVRV
jgi:hypothetical protein